MKCILSILSICFVLTGCGEISSSYLQNSLKKADLETTLAKLPEVTASRDIIIYSYNQFDNDDTIIQKISDTIQLQSKYTNYPMQSWRVKNLASRTMLKGLRTVKVNNNFILYDYVNGHQGELEVLTKISFPISIQIISKAEIPNSLYQNLKKYNIKINVHQAIEGKAGIPSYPFLADSNIIKTDVEQMLSSIQKRYENEQNNLLCSIERNNVIKSNKIEKIHYTFNPKAELLNKKGIIYMNPIPFSKCGSSDAYYKMTLILKEGFIVQSNITPSSISYNDFPENGINVSVSIYSFKTNIKTLLSYYFPQTTYNLKDLNCSLSQFNIGKDVDIPITITNKTSKFIAIKQISIGLYDVILTNRYDVSFPPHSENNITLSGDISDKLRNILKKK